MTTPRHLEIVGIDEAGRGPLAGPVAIGVLKISKLNLRKIAKELRKIRGKDSKKLSHALRTMWFEKIKIWKKSRMLDFHVSLVSHTYIDKNGINAAIELGIRNSLKKVKAVPERSRVVLDGSLKAPSEFKNQKTIIKGDEKEPVIGLASIAAKVTRDRHMISLALRYPEYRFEVHKGYGTKVHREALKIYGPSKVHRRSFLRNFSFLL